MKAIPVMSSARSRAAAMMRSSIASWVVSSSSTRHQRRASVSVTGSVAGAVSCRRYGTVI